MAPAWLLPGVMAVGVPSTVMVTFRPCAPVTADLAPRDSLVR
jgi:hypothetical protein